jgi:hypothetical protein
LVLFALTLPTAVPLADLPLARALAQRVVDDQGCVDERQTRLAAGRLGQPGQGLFEATGPAAINHCAIPVDGGHACLIRLGTGSTLRPGEVDACEPFRLHEP